MGRFKYIVYSSDMEKLSFIEEYKKKGVKCISALDTRSAIYMATGICAQNNEPVIVCVNSSNASRSAFSGMTEAFYRKLPVVLVTFGQELDYSKELADIIVGHYIVSTENEIEKLLNDKYPIHIEVINHGQEIEKIECDDIQRILSSVLNDNMYLYIGQGIVRTVNNCKCKVVQGGMPNCCEGAVANVLGASLTNLRDRYIGLITEEEFLHDINTLGNININDLLLFFIVGIKENKTIIEYADSLGFETISIKMDEVNVDNVKSILNNKKKAFVMIYKED